jgi:pyruvate/2-oxoglutarate dehydrogenase complex dihydrolipoamide dehydrogenase (E3) component
MKDMHVDVAVIGGGTAGLVSAAGCAALGARTILIERDRLGGECTWRGCVPSKTLLHVARQVDAARRLPALGVRIGEPEVDFRSVMSHVRQMRQEIHDRNESPAHLRRLGIRPLQAGARFLGPHLLELERRGHTRTVAFRTAIIAAGSSPSIPSVEGLETVPYLTTDTIFEIDELPRRLAVLGGGATGVEMAQAFARLGSEVTIVSDAAQLLPGFDDWAAEMIADVLSADGVELELGQKLRQVQPLDRGLRLTISHNDAVSSLDVDRLLIATGKRPNVDGLGLDAAGVDFGPRGVTVDAWCRTTAGHFFAVGDVTPASGFTHVAENMGRAAAINAVSRLPLARYEDRVIPSVIYTDPELATLGAAQRELDAAGETYDVIEFPFEKVDRAYIERRATGSIRICHRRGRILGAAIVGPEAGELIAEYALAMKHGLRLDALAETVHAYPTMMLGARRAADQFYLRMLRRWMVKGVQFAYGYRGAIPDYIGTRQII